MIASDWIRCETGDVPELPFMHCYPPSAFFARFLQSTQSARPGHIEHDIADVYLGISDLGLNQQQTDITVLSVDLMN